MILKYASKIGFLTVNSVCYIQVSAGSFQW
jgi:hypothetical protein